MTKKKKIIVASAAAVVGVLALSSGAVAAQHYVITSSSQIKDGSIAARDLTLNARKSLKGRTGATGAQGVKGETGARGPQGLKGDTAPAADPKPGAKGDPGAQGPKGDIGPAGPKGDKGDKGDPAPILTSGNWGVINRNTIGSPSAFLRSGPTAATPFGKGSLNLLVGSGTEKVAYGNEIDFAGTPLSSLTAVGFNVYTTGEDITAGNGTPNMPGIAFEIDPNVTGKSHYSSLVFMPNNTAANTWSGYIDATKADSGLWGGTGSAFAGTKCDINGTRCTWDELQAYLKDNNNGTTPARITYSVAVTKGRDFAWQGAIDGLRINNSVFDFEETGVAERPAA